MKLSMTAYPSSHRRAIPAEKYLIYNIGDKLKMLRLSFGLTLKNVAGENGITAGMLSLVENDKICASVALLSKLTEFYGVKMSWLFNSRSDMKKYNIVRKNDILSNNRLILYKDDGVSAGSYCETLLVDKHSKMRPYIVHLDNSCFSNKVYNTAATFIYVLRGEIEITAFSGMATILSEGDSIYLNQAYTMLTKTCNYDEIKLLVVDIPNNCQKLENIYFK